MKRKSKIELALLVLKLNNLELEYKFVEQANREMFVIGGLYYYDDLSSYYADLEKLEAKNNASLNKMQCAPCLEKYGKNNCPCKIEAQRNATLIDCQKTVIFALRTGELNIGAIMPQTNLQTSPKHV